jgi:hypothetical protein
VVLARSLGHHAQRDSAATGLGVVELALNQVGLNPALREGLCDGPTGWSPADHSHPEVPVGQSWAGFRSHDCELSGILGVVFGLGGREVGFLCRGLAESNEGFEGNGGHHLSELELRA